MKRFHLSTLLLLILLAGAFVGANVVEQYEGQPPHLYVYRGWPVRCQVTRVSILMQHAFSWQRLSCNIVIGLAALALAGYVSEKIARRRRMSDKPRRFWQIHLSTAVALSIAAGILLWANLTQDEMRLLPNAYTYGWPQKVLGGVPAGVPLADQARAEELEATITNLAVSLSILFNVAVAVEYFTRRRSKP